MGQSPVINRQKVVNNLQRQEERLGKNMNFFHKMWDGENRKIIDYHQQDINKRRQTKAAIYNSFFEDENETSKRDIIPKN
jgi:hypothetical protein